MSASAAYKDLGSPAVIAVRAALDLHRLVPDAVPVVVEYVLATAVDEIVVATQAEGEDPEVTLDVEALVEAAKVTDVGAAPSMPPLCPGTLLHAAVGGHNWRGADAGLAPGRAAVLLFRDLQTARLLASA